MLRVTNLKKLLGSLETFPTNYTNFQSLRWRRKPRWLPVAKSKMYRVPPRTVTPTEERLELMRLYNNYRTQMKAIRSYLHSEYNVKSVIVDTEEHEKRFAEEFAACCKVNDAWNEERRREREARHMSELEQSKQVAYKRLDERLESNKKLLESVEEIVRKEKEASKNFITAENIDAAIEQVLASTVDYNFAIDLEGNFYHGRDTKPEPPKEQVKISN